MCDRQLKTTLDLPPILNGRLLLAELLLPRRCSKGDDYQRRSSASKQDFVVRPKPDKTKPLKHFSHGCILGPGYQIGNMVAQQCFSVAVRGTAAVAQK